MNKEEFIDKFKTIFEHAPWVAKNAWEIGIKKSHDDIDTLHELFVQVICAAPFAKRKKLIASHPQLAVPVPKGKANEFSHGEQQRAGLGSLDDAQKKEFAQLNKKYISKHGIPFILAVEGLTSTTILEKFRERIKEDSTDTEINTALSEVFKIGRLRLGRL